MQLPSPLHEPCSSLRHPLQPPACRFARLRFAPETVARSSIASFGERASSISRTGTRIPIPSCVPLHAVCVVLCPEQALMPYVPQGHVLTCICASQSVALWRSARCSLAPMRMASVRLAPRNLVSIRSASRRLAELKLALTNIAPVQRSVKQKQTRAVGNGTRSDLSILHSPGLIPP